VVSFKPKKIQKKFKKKEKTQEKKVGIVRTLEIHLLSFIFLNFSLGSIQVLDGFYFLKNKFDFDWVIK
jgi:hypothetical protein